MSRPPPKIEQVIDGAPTIGYTVLPIKNGDQIYSLEKTRKVAGSAIECSVVARDMVGTVLWKSLYMSQELIPFLEMDVQEIYPVDFFLKGEKIIIKHEHYSEDEGIYMINAKNGKLIESVQRKSIKKRSGVFEL